MGTTSSKIKCTCKNGYPEEGKVCTKRDSERCVGCKSGYRIGKGRCTKSWNVGIYDGLTTTTSSKIKCTCKNGDAISGKVCTKRKRQRCRRCDSGYALSRSSTCIYQKHTESEVMQLNKPASNVGGALQKKGNAKPLSRPSNSNSQNQRPIRPTSRDPKEQMEERAGQTNSNPVSGVGSMMGGKSSAPS